MKSKLYMFTIMFFIWCLFNESTLWVIVKTRSMPSDTYMNPLFLLPAIVFSAIAAIWPRYFMGVMGYIVLIEVCWLIVMLIQGIEGNRGFVSLLAA